MKITKFINLSFVAKSTTTASVYIPFKVKKIHVKSFGYVAGTNGTTNYVCLVSDLCETPNSPLCIMNQDTTYSSGTICDVELEFKNPRSIQGTYSFQILKMDGSPASTSNAGAATDTVGIVLEFNCEDEIY